jgi:bifunctional ADP-heptose synthase (sugar kinase/adenylyltransferase)
VRGGADGAGAQGCYRGRASTACLPVIVDPKSHDYSLYCGATLITPNTKELVAAVRRPLATD